MNKTTKTFKQQLNPSPNWHIEIHKGSPNNKFSSAWRIDHFWLPEKLLKEFDNNSEELDFIRKYQ